MLIALLVLAVCVLAVAIYILRADARRRSTPPALDEWWPEFERAFRDYAARGAQSRPPKHRHRGS